MGRKPAFDRETVLQKALCAFWWDGYDKTSLEDLLKVMEIKTSSFYNSFESKEALFFEALQHYRQNIVRERLSILDSLELDSKTALTKYFEHLIFRKNMPGFPSGCFMMKTAANLSDPNSKVGKEVSTAIANLEKSFVATLSRGQKNKEFRKDIDVDQFAQLFMAAAYGISVLTRTKKTKKELLSIAHTLIKAASLPNSKEHV